MSVRPAKTQISLGIRAQWVAKDTRFLHADSKDSDQTGQTLTDWADAQADLSLRWAHNHIVGFVTRQLILT